MYPLPNHQIQNDMIFNFASIVGCVKFYAKKKIHDPKCLSSWLRNRKESCILHYLKVEFGFEKSKRTCIAKFAMMLETTVTCLIASKQTCSNNKTVCDYCHQRQGHQAAGSVKHNRVRHMPRLHWNYHFARLYMTIKANSESK